MANSKVLIIFAAIMFISLASAETFTFIQHEFVDYRFRCIDTDSNYCTSGTSLVINIEAPDGSNVRENISMTHNPTYYNVSLPTNNTGKYNAIILAPGNSNTTTEFSYDVTKTGDEINAGTSIIYVIIFVLSIGFFLLTLFGSIKIPWKHQRNEQGFIVSKNDMKYLKLFLWFITYLIAIFIFFMAQSISQNVLGADVASNIFNTTFYFLSVFLLPVFVITALIGFASFWNDKKLFSLQQRGLRPR